MKLLLGNFFNLEIPIIQSILIGLTPVPSQKCTVGESVRHDRWWLLQVFNCKKVHCPNEPLKHDLFGIGVLFMFTKFLAECKTTGEFSQGFANTESTVLAQTWFRTNTKCTRVSFLHLRLEMRFSVWKED